HEQVLVPEPPRLGAVGTDPACEGRQVEDELGARVLEEPHDVVLPAEVVPGAPRHGDLVTTALELLDHVRAEEAGSARDEHPRHRVTWGAPVGSQSTRPIQRSRLSAYQRIVCRTPSSQLTLGSQPVSSVSLSCPTRSAITSLAPGR